MLVKKPIKCAIFDLDGTLLDTESQMGIILPKFFEKYGITVTDEFRQRILGMLFKDIHKILVDEYDLKLDFETFQRERSQFEKENFRNIELIDGAERLIRHLSVISIPLAIATNSFMEDVEFRIANHKDLFNLFHHITTPDGLNSGKPEPKIYLIALSKFSEKYEPAETLVFEDSLTGGTAALKAGMNVVLINNSNFTTRDKEKFMMSVEKLESFDPTSVGLPEFEDVFKAIVMSGKGIKRKKLSFTQYSMKLHKRGKHGQGTRIENDTFEYFLNILKVMNQEFDTDEDKQAFVENVFVQMDGNEVEYSCNQVVSRIVDTLLPFISEERLENFMELFSKQIRPVCMDPYATFVLQKLIITVMDRYLLYDYAERAEEAAIKKFNWLMKTIKFVLNNLEEFVFDNYPNRVMRTAVCCLVGHTEAVSNDALIEFDSERVPNDFTKILKDFSDTLLNWNQLCKMPRETFASGFLQIFLRCLVPVSPRRVDKIGQKLVCEYYNSNTQNNDDNSNKKLYEGVEDEASNRLLEVLIGVVSSKLYNNIYSTCFASRMKLLACHPKANFCVQKLLKHCSDKANFELMYDELETSFNNIAQDGYSGVITNLSDTCVRLKVKQSSFIQAWMKYLKCDDHSSQNLIAPLTIFWKQKGDYNELSENKVSLHGSLILQNLLKFGKPIKIINSFLELKSECICKILCSPQGSYVANAFFEAEYVGEKSKEKFFKTLSGHYSTFGVSKHGSRVFDIVWKWASVKNRALIASELLADEAKLSSSNFGRPIIYNIGLSTFRHSKDKWMEAQNTVDKAQKMFSDILT